MQRVLLVEAQEYVPLGTGDEVLFLSVLSAWKPLWIITGSLLSVRPVKIFVCAGWQIFVSK